MAPQDPPPADTPDPARIAARRFAAGALMLVGIAAFATFWAWALFFASKEAVNKIDDVAWAARAEQICIEADAARLELVDLRPITEAVPELVLERADIVDRATDILDRMVDDIVAVAPADPKGRAIVPAWEADYRTYLQDRRNYTATLRAAGENSAFYESQVDGIPISERIATFAGDNEMAACAPPFDLTR
ncbi:MAG TPA: hypothetical protein VIS05_03560 [Ilumatobacter sp.]